MHCCVFTTDANQFWKSDSNTLSITASLYYNRSLRIINEEISKKRKYGKASEKRRTKLIGHDISITEFTRYASGKE